MTTPDDDLIERVARAIDPDVFETEAPTEFHSRWPWALRRSAARAKAYAAVTGNPISGPDGKPIPALNPAPAKPDGDA